MGGTTGGVWVYTSLISYIDNHSSFSSCSQFLHDAGYILGTLWQNVYRVGGVGHNNCRRWAGNNQLSNCSFSNFVNWFNQNVIGNFNTANELGVNISGGLGYFNNLTDLLASQVDGGSLEGTLAYWFSRLDTNQLQVLNTVASLSEDVITKGICTSAGEVVGWVASEACSNGY